MALNDNLRANVVKDLKGLEMLRFDSYARDNGAIINSLHEHGVIDDESIEGALEKAVIDQARRDYRVITKEGSFTDYADHVGRPDCFAYALEKGEFSKKEVKKISFDHGDTAKTFPRRYGKENLLSYLREGLLASKPTRESGCGGNCSCSK